MSSNTPPDWRCTTYHAGPSAVDTPFMAHWRRRGSMGVQGEGAVAPLLLLLLAGTSVVALTAPASGATVEVASFSTSSNTTMPESLDMRYAGVELDVFKNMESVRKSQSKFMDCVGT